MRMMRLISVLTFRASRGSVCSSLRLGRANPNLASRGHVRASRGAHSDAYDTPDSDSHPGARRTDSDSKAGSGGNGDANPRAHAYSQPRVRHGGLP